MLSLRIKPNKLQKLTSSQYKPKEERIKPKDFANRNEISTALGERERIDPFACFLICRFWRLDQITSSSFLSIKLHVRLSYTSLAPFIS